MSNVQLGSLVLNGALLVYLAAGMAGVAAVRLCRRGREERDKDISVAWNAVFIWLAVWKLSLLVVDPVGTFRQPLSLIWLDGGRVGFLFACAAAWGYSLARYVRMYGIGTALRLSGAAAAAWLSVYLAARLIFAADYTGVVHWLGLLLAATALAALANPGGAPERWLRQFGRGKEMGTIVRPLLQGASLLLVLALTAGMLNGQMEAGGLLNRAKKADDVSETAPRPGARAPSPDGMNLAKEPVTLAQHQGSVVVVTFWTTWCRVCKSVLPQLGTLADGYAGAPSDVTVLSVNATGQETGAEHVRQYAAAQRYTFPVVLDESGEWESAYRITAFPTTFIVDREGIVRERLVGAIGYDDLRERVEHIRRLADPA